MIKITKELEACLHIVKHLAMRGQGVSVPRKDIAEATGISYGFLQGPVNHLRRAGIIKSAYGRSGGLVLMRDPKELCLAEVIKACTGEDLSSYLEVSWRRSAFNGFIDDLRFSVAFCASSWTAADLID